jgi:hypothetical protein
MFLRPLLGALLLGSACLHAQSKQDPPADPELILTLQQLEKRMDITFDQAFPKDWDIDLRLKKPFASIQTATGKIRATRPNLVPEEDYSVLEWHVAPEDPAKPLSDSLFCLLDIDKSGGVLQVTLLANDSDPWTKGDPIRSREDGESSRDYFQRVMITYRLRTKQAENPGQAALLLSGFEKMATAIQSLHQEKELLKR